MIGRLLCGVGWHQPKVVLEPDKARFQRGVVRCAREHCRKVLS